ncbi:hypothetical protein [Streptomyces sp. NBC_00878]|uniref:hypothetical protein n=1 Tax=Streptomyces sp. NBC_00878 TaxID=2975854 RepID=UPI00224D805D|nr:hypothetical protein [Streptomyces sp. NBC_00878]MCX4906207.1 hypothetical protein [Streptomyces sp. NBC_00878]
MTQNGRYIPEPIKRQIRQRCGFGCVICGLPLYEYEHMREWSIVKEHNPDEMTILCPTHHAEKTRGLLPIAEVLTANSKPHNLRFGMSEAFPLRYSGDSCLVNFGSNRFMHDFARDAVISALTIRGYPVIRIKKQDGSLLLSLRIFDKEGKLLLDVDENELIFSVDSWDVELVGKRLTIRSGLRAILAQVEFVAPSAIIINRGTFAYDGFQVQVAPDHILLEKYNIRMEKTSARMNGGGGFRFD